VQLLEQEDLIFYIKFTMVNTFYTSSCCKKVKDLNLILAPFSELDTADYSYLKLEFYSIAVTT